MRASHVLDRREARETPVITHNGPVQETDPVQMLGIQLQNLEILRRSFDSKDSPPAARAFYTRP